MNSKQLSMQDLFRKSKQEWLDEARAAARRLLMSRYSITIEDVLEVCPRPTYLHRNTTGSVFNDNDFTPVSYAPSRRTVSHGRTVRTWTFHERPYVNDLPRSRRMFRQRVESLED